MPRSIHLSHVLTIAAVLLPHWAHADAVAPRPTFSSRAYRAEDGLPASVVFALAQDTDGYLWLGTASGLVRFDGMQFVTWGAYGEPPLPYNEVRSLLADPHGGIWIGFNEGGVVSHLVGDRLQTYTVRDGLPDGVVMPRLQDRDGVTWAAGAAGIATFRDGRWEQLHGRRGLPPVSAYTVYEDRAGTIWAGTAAGVFRRAHGREQFDFVRRDPVLAFSEDGEGHIWITDRRYGLRRMTGASDRPHAPATPTAFGGVLLHDRRGDFWTGSTIRGGLVHVSIDPRTLRQTARTLAGERGLASEIVLALLEDGEGNIWVGTPGGLLRFYEPNVRTFSRADGLATDNVRAVEIADDGRLWIGTSGGLTTVARDGTGQPVAVPGVKGRGVMAMRADRQGRLWVGFADSGLGVIAGGRYLALVPQDNTTLGIFSALQPDANGDLWLCHGADAGVYRWRHAALTKFDSGYNLGRRTCTAALLERSGRMWLGFDDGSLLVHDAGRVQSYAHQNGVPHGRVCAMYEDRQGAVWVATTAGISRFQDGHFSTLAARNGLPGDYFTAVVEDRNGDLWLGANSGIIRLTRREFEDTVADPAHRVQYTLYDSSDGVADPPVCYGKPPAVLDRDGRLWFATVNGAIIVDPRGPHTSPPPLAPRVERVIADGQRLAAHTPISLPPRTAKLELNYTAISLSAASKVRFRYRLEGFDVSWVDAGSRRQAFYTNLPPGRYRFQVRASINGSEESTTSWDFAVDPAFYQTRSFLAATVASLALLIWGAWQLRVRSLHTQYALVMDERTRIGREIHDTVLQNMAGVALQLEGLARKMKTPATPASDELNAISREVKEHITQARHTIWDLRSPARHDGALPAELRALAGQLLAKSRLRFEVSVAGTPRACGGDVEQELLRIAREAIRNALLHADAQCIRLALTYADDALRLVISDDGRGFKADEYAAVERDHWGLTGMRERANRIGAQFRIDSHAGGGTAIEMVVRYG